MARNDDDDRSSRRRSSMEREAEPRRSARDDERGSRRSSRDDDRGSRSGGRSYHYEARSKADVDKRSSQGANDFDRLLIDTVKAWKVNDKDNTIRILPPTWAKPKHYGLDIWVHYGVGPDRQSYLCLNKMADAANDYADRVEKKEPSLADAIRASAHKCPICAEREEILRDGDDKAAKELEPKRRVLVYLIDRDNEKEGLQAWAMPWTVDRDLCKVSVDKKTGEVLPLDHPEEGFDVEFEKKGAKDRTEYLGIAVARRDSSLGNDKWLEEAQDNPLPEMLQFFDAEHIGKAFGGGGSHRSSRDDDDRGSRRSSRDDDDDKPKRSSRDDDDDRGSRRREPEKEPDPEYTWEQVHDMTSSELDAVCEDQDLKLNPNKFDSDEELADAICEELGIVKAARGRRSVRDDEPEKDDRSEGRSKLAEMRGRRERG